MFSSFTFGKSNKPDTFRRSTQKQQDDDNAPSWDEVPDVSASRGRSSSPDPQQASYTRPRGTTDSLRRQLEALDESHNFALTSSGMNLDTMDATTPRKRAPSVSPADVFGVRRSADSQAREFDRMTGPVTILNESDFVVFGDPDEQDDLPGHRPRNYVRGTRSKLVLRPDENMVAIENTLSHNTLVAPAALKQPVHSIHTLPNPSLVPRPRVDAQRSSRFKNYIPPPLSAAPDFDEVDVVGHHPESDDPFADTAILPRGGKGAGRGGPPISLDANRQPAYVPLAVRPLGHDEVVWRPPVKEDRDKRFDPFAVTEATVAERPPPPPGSTRDVARMYRARQRLVAYDETEAFGFRARPLYDNGVLEELRRAMQSQIQEGTLPRDASIATIRHDTTCYIFAADRRVMLRFTPQDADRNIGNQGQWERVELHDGSMFIGVTAYPPPDALICPIPNIPYMVAASNTMLHILSIEDGVWFLCCLRGIEPVRPVGFTHLVDECTLYVRDRSKRAHGMIPLRQVLEELTIFRRCPHDLDTDLLSFFVENRLKYVEASQLRRAPCTDSLVAVEGVPGVAIHPCLKEGHCWVFIYSPIAKTFLPFQRLDVSVLLFVTMTNHLRFDATTVLFFSEQLHRMDIGTVVPDNLSRAVAGSRGTSTQRILRVAYRLVVRNVEQTAAEPKEDIIHTPPHRRKGRNESMRLFTVPSSEATILRWKRLGAVLTPDETGGSLSSTTSIHTTTTSTEPSSEKYATKPQGSTDIVTTTLPLEQRVTVEPVSGVAGAKGGTVDLVIKARRNEIHTVIPMADRCAAVVAFDCSTYVVVELDRAAWMKTLTTEEP